MCWMVAIPIAMAAAQGAMNNMSANQQTAAQNEALRQQNVGLVKTMNYEDANLKLEGADTQDGLRQQQTENNMQQIRNMGTLKAALGETGLEGNSMKRIERVTEGDYARQSQGLNDNYERDYAAIFGKRVSNIENSRGQIEANIAKEGRVKGVLEQIIDPLGLGMDKLYKFTDVGGKKIYGNKLKAKTDADSKKAGN